MTTRADIIERALTWIGTPFHEQACVKGIGCDCGHLWVGVARELGLVAPDFDVPQGYARHADSKGTLLKWCREYMGAERTLGQMVPGMGVVIQYEARPQHMGIVVPYWHE